jgi:acyl dehydratase
MVLDGIDAVKAAAGSHLGWSGWREITRAHVEAFAAATGNPTADGVAPYQTLALSNFFLPQIVDVRGMSLGVNYGCDRIRFPAPVAIGARLRAGAELTAVVDIAGGVQTTMTITVEAEGSAEPVCVIESLSRYLV